MKIQDWFKDKDYDLGVELYAGLPRSNKQLLYFLKQGYTAKNKVTLMYELNKYRSTNVSLKSKEKVIKPIIESKEKVIAKCIHKSIENSNERVKMAMLPTPYLRKRFVEKNNAFYSYCELKYQLNDLPAEEEDKALELITEIMKLNAFIDAIWTEIDYFLEHRKLPPTANDYSSWTYREQIKELQLLYQRRSKRTNTLNRWKEEFKQLNSPSKEAKLKAKIAQKEEELNQIEVNIKTLKELTS
ncbi:conserved hypothetical protein [Tenacibaculum sp. 190524A02b]|uniref:Uncharacterized protein n=1 Tax=Tenacibaculum vairaonense TaxID=3137860 RepID=A0ABM9PIP0_9FLAO